MDLTLIRDLDRLLPGFEDYLDSPENQFTGREPHAVFAAASHFVRERHVPPEAWPALGRFLTATVAGPDLVRAEAASTCFLENIAAADHPVKQYLVGEAKKYWEVWEAAGVSLATPLMRLKSVNSDAELEFSNVRGDLFDFRIRSHDYSAVREVSAYTDAGGVARLFAEAAREWRGWKLPKVWESLEGELRLQLTMDRTGHVTLAVRLRSPLGSHDAWSVDCSIGLEAGQLDAFAAEAKRLWLG